MGTSAAASAGASRAAGELAGWVPPLARAGYAAKGVVYLGIGWLAASAGFRGGEAAGSREAIATLARESAGEPVLWLIGLGLMGFVVWRLVQAFVDPEGEGGAKRVAFLVSGLIYAGLSVWTIQAAMERGGDAAAGGGSGGGWTATLMRQPFGRWLVAAAGLAVAGYGVAELWKAYRARVADRLKPSLPSGTRRWVVRSARIGLAARGVVMLVIGALLVAAGWTSDPSGNQGLGGALQTLREQPYGPWLLGLVGVGLAAYGAYQLVQARYRRIGPVAF